jgi:hypothetical protein
MDHRFDGPGSLNPALGQVGPSSCPLPIAAEYTAHSGKPDPTPQDPPDPSQEGCQSGQVPPSGFLLNWTEALGQVRMLWVRWVRGLGSDFHTLNFTCSCQLNNNLVGIYVLRMCTPHAHCTEYKNNTVGSARIIGFGQQDIFIHALRVGNGTCTFRLQGPSLNHHVTSLLVFFFFFCKVSLNRGWSHLQFP